MFRKFFVALVLSIITMIFSAAEAADTWACSYEDNGTRFDYYVRDVPSTMHFLNSPPTFLSMGSYVPMCVDVVRVSTDLRTGKVKNTSTMEYAFSESRGHGVYSINREQQLRWFDPDSISGKIAIGIHEKAIKFVENNSELAYEKGDYKLKDYYYVKSVSRGSNGHVYAEVLSSQYGEKDFWLAGGIEIYEFWSDENNGLHCKKYCYYDDNKKSWQVYSEPDDKKLIAIFKTTIKMLKNQTS